MSWGRFKGALARKVISIEVSLPGTSIFHVPDVTLRVPAATLDTENGNA